ncbi:nucleotidyltransferase family protein [Methylocystis heyeri]|uniref:NTP transferase domain-containing protein n=1 Tax=Methylocystis heyeri TaxID=391905 RepID=A0A6B8KFN2_9HYPH|nr:nucleotidyltransferase family protein [Methylocystis heyeri]QGM45240.1 NTP transferase domain-containing protein [Methylocystis heyeri]
MKTDLDDIVIGEQATVLDAIQAIDRGAVNLALVVGPERRLIATVTDGDTRRGILRGVGLDAPVSEVMRRNPLAVEENDSRTAALRLMREHKISQVPVVDAEGRVLGLELIGEMIEPSSNERWVVLMAGGRGDRLRPLTDSIPKPMLPIGGRPLLESIIRNLSAQGFRKFYISVNYKREIIQSYFRDGRDFDVEIQYLVENEKLGTAGSLALLPSRPTKPFIVMNADLMTLVHFQSLLRFHEDHVADATVCVREHVTQSPFGVVRFEGVRLVGIDEKPKYSHMINAGIYVLAPEALDYVKAGEACDMPTVCEAMIVKGSKVCVFPIRESWVDIGNKDDMEKARREFGGLFPEML